MVKRSITFSILVIIYTGALAQKGAIKTNLLYSGTTTINLGVEFRTGRKSTFDIPVNYNPWTFSDNKKLKHILVQPELRRWLCEPFNLGFWGIHGHYSYFNVGGLNLPFGKLKNIEDNRYEGWLAGAGLSAGGQWFISPRWNIEATIGFGYAYINYKKYKCQNCGEQIGNGDRHYFGPTKAGIGLVYLLNNGKGNNRKYFGPWK